MKSQISIIPITECLSQVIITLESGATFQIDVDDTVNHLVLRNVEDKVSGDNLIVAAMDYNLIKVGITYLL